MAALMKIRTLFVFTTIPSVWVKTANAPVVEHAASCA